MVFLWRKKHEITFLFSAFTAEFDAHIEDGGSHFRIAVISLDIQNAVESGDLKHLFDDLIGIADRYRVFTVGGHDLVG